MFTPDVIQLKQFYATALGRTVRRYISESVLQLWEITPGSRLLGVGYATPVLHAVLRKCSDYTGIAAMPATQGATYWPNSGNNHAFMYDETNFAIPDQHMTHIIVMHALENSEHLRQLLQELWRILIPGGRIIFIVPNRRSIWARARTSPFAYGQPFSRSQLKELITKNHFTVKHFGSALHYWPSTLRLAYRITPWLEKIGRIIWPAFGGVWVLDVEKQLFASVNKPLSSPLFTGYTPVPSKPAMTRVK